jgi:PAS domain-containing protein
VTVEAMRQIEEEKDYYRREVEELRRSHQRLIDFVATAGEIIWETDADLRIATGLQILSNGRFLDVEVPTHNGHLQGGTIFDAMGKNPLCAPPVETHLADLAAHRPFRSFVCQVHLADGTTMWAESNGNPFFGEDGVFLGYRGTSKDITRRKNDEQRIAFLAHRDSLTSLPNRQLFLERIEEALVLLGHKILGLLDIAVEGASM